jgi:hypothetical protein
MRIMITIFMFLSLPVSIFAQCESGYNITGQYSALRGENRILNSTTMFGLSYEWDNKKNVISVGNLNKSSLFDNGKIKSLLGKDFKISYFDKYASLVSNNAPRLIQHYNPILHKSIIPLTPFSADCLCCRVTVENCINNNFIFSEKNSKTTVAKQILKQFLYGELVGIGSSLFSASIYGLAIANNENGIGNLGPGLIITYSTYVLGNSFGVYIAGKKDKKKGNYLYSLAGGILGTLFGIKLFDYSGQKGYGSFALMLGPPIGSIIGFSLSN